MMDLVAPLSRMNPTPSRLGPLSFPAYSMTFPFCTVNLPCPSIQCSAIPKILMLSLVISLAMTSSFAVFAPLMFHVANTAFFRRWIPFLSILQPSGAALPETGFGATPSSWACLANVFTKVVENVLYSRMDEYRQSTFNQFGFKRKHGTEIE